MKNHLQTARGAYHRLFASRIALERAMDDDVEMIDMLPRGLRERLHDVVRVISERVASHLIPASVNDQRAQAVGVPARYPFPLLRRQERVHAPGILVVQGREERFRDRRRQRDLVTAALQLARDQCCRDLGISQFLGLWPTAGSDPPLPSHPLPPPPSPP